MFKSVLAALVGLSVLGAPAYAQNRSAVDVLPELVYNGALLGTTNAPGDHRFDFATGSALTSVPADLNAAIALQVANMPLGPVSGGLVFSRDGSPEGARPTAATSYGPRGMLVGKGNLAASVVFQDTNFESLDGANIRSGVNFLFSNTKTSGTGSTDVLQETLYVRVNRKVTSFVVDYGVSDRLEVGIVAPVVQVALAGRVSSRLLGLKSTPALNFDPLKRATRTTYLDFDQYLTGVTEFGTDGRLSRGFGDIQLRARLAALRTDTTGVAASVDFSLPTGNSADFRGTGAYRITPAVAFTHVAGRVSPHASASYTYSEGELSSDFQRVDPSRPIDLNVPNEINWTAGVDLGLMPRTTLMAEAVGRRVMDVQRFGTGATAFAGGASPDVTAATDLVTSGRGDLNQVFANVGGRFNLGEAWFANVSALIPVSVDGLKPAASAVFTINHGF